MLCGQGLRLTRLYLYKVSVMLILFTLLIFFFFSLFLPISQSPLPSSSSNLDSRTCKIPSIPLRSAAYNETLTWIPPISQCNEDTRPLSKFFKNGTLKFFRRDLYPRKECSAFEILRPEQLLNDRHLLRELEPFDERNEIHSISSEHVMVACGTDSLRYNYHYRIPVSKPSVKAKVKKWEDKRDQMPINVMILVLDSTSAADASRHLPLTMNYLKSELNFLQFDKYHALGEPTMFNALPMLTGLSPGELYKKRLWTDPWDGVEFIWKKFQKSGYVTSYMEEIPFSGTFNYGLQTGFVNAPTEIYPRPLFSAWELNKKEKKRCIGNSSLWKFVYGYTLEILRTLNGAAPSLTIPWLVWPFHDNFGTLSALDAETLIFFRELSTSASILENTLLVVMADHGFYSHAYSATHAGLLERRLPLFMLRVPEKLKMQIPNITQIILDNSQRVVSHFDLHKTLVHISQMAREPLGTKNAARGGEGDGISRGRSLLRPIPEGRSCREAEIPESWCACNLPPPPPFSDVPIPDTVQLDVESFHTQRARDWFGLTI